MPPRRKETRWIKLFLEFIKELRIQSKEVSATDERGSELKLWGSQRIFLEELAAGLEDGVRMFVFLKSRQIGITTITLAVDIFWMAAYPGTLGALVVDTEENRNIFRATIRRYVNSLPAQYRGKFSIKKGGDNRSFMAFTNGSRLDFIVAGKTKANWGEGRGYSFAHLTEVAAYGNPKGLTSFRETLAETHPDRLFIYESTAKGPNHWRDMWRDAERDTFTKRAVFIGWWAKEINQIRRSDRMFSIYGVSPPDGEESKLINLVYEQYNVAITMEQLAWIRWRMSDEATSQQDIDQNLPWVSSQAFVQEGFSYFAMRMIEKHIDRIYETPVMYKGYMYWFGNDFWAGKMEQLEADRAHEVTLKVWEEPVQDAQYVIGCDPAYGRNDWGDRSAISVWRCYADKLVQVAEWADEKVETRQAAWVLAHLAGAYSKCMVMLELTGGPGRVIMVEFQHLRDRLKAEMYSEQVKGKGWEDFLAHARWYIYHRPDSMGSGYVWNWETSWRTKFEIMNQLRDSYHTELMVVNSVDLLEEMSNVVQDGSEIGAPGRGKDDRVMGAALANRAWKEWIRPSLIAQGYTYAMVQSREAGESTAASTLVNKIVWDYFKSAEERGNEPEPDWLEEKGLR